MARRRAKIALLQRHDRVIDTLLEIDPSANFVTDGPGAVYGLGYSKFMPGSIDARFDGQLR